MALQKQPYIRPFLQYILLEQLLLIEFLNLRNHILDLLFIFKKVAYKIRSLASTEGNL